MPYIDFARVSEQLDIADVLALLDWEASSYDSTMARGPCPIHLLWSSEMSRTFSVHLAGNMFRCFKPDCLGSKGGNALDLYAMAQGLTPYQAALTLMDEFQIDA